MRPEWKWPLGISAVLGLSVAVNLAVMAVAGNDPSFAVEPDYYQKAVDWDRHAAQQAASNALGWTAEVTLEPGPSPRLNLRLRDGTGLAIEGAAVSVEAFHIARAADFLKTDLREDASHLYSGQMGVHRPGLWEFRLTATRGIDRFETVVRKELQRTRP